MHAWKIERFWNEETETLIGNPPRDLAFPRSSALGSRAHLIRYYKLARLGFLSYQILHNLYDKLYLGIDFA